MQFNAPRAVKLYVGRQTYPSNNTTLPLSYAGADASYELECGISCSVTDVACG